MHNKCRLILPIATLIVSIISMVLQICISRNTEKLTMLQNKPIILVQYRLYSSQEAIDNPPKDTGFDIFDNIPEVDAEDFSIRNVGAPIRSLDSVLYKSFIKLTLTDLPTKEHYIPIDNYFLFTEKTGELQGVIYKSSYGDIERNRKKKLNLELPFLGRKDINCSLITIFSINYKDLYNNSQVEYFIDETPCEKESVDKIINQAKLDYHYPIPLPQFDIDEIIAQIKKKSQ